MRVAPVVDAPLDERPQPARRPGRRWLSELSEWPLSVVLIALPAIVGGLRLLGSIHRPFTAGGDVAFIELTIRDALHGRVSLGPYSRFGWHHVGPAMFYLFAPIYGLSGGSSRSLFLDAWLLNCGSALGVVLIVRRSAGETAARLAALVFCVYVGAITFGSLINPWNPSLLAMPLLLLLAATALAATGSVWGLVVAVASGSYLVQTHLGTAPLVGLALVAGAAAWFVHRRRHGGGPLRRPLVAGAVLLVLLWGPPLGQQLFSGHGNLTRVVRFYADPPASAGVNGHPLHDSAQIVANYATVVPLGNPDLAARRHRGLAAAVWAAIGLLAAAVGWRRHRFLAWLALATPVGLAVGVVAATRVIGPLPGYLFQWTESLALPAFIAALALLAAVVTHVLPRPAGVLIAGAVGLAAIGAGVVATRVVVHADVISYSDSPSARVAASRIEDAVGHDRSRVFKIRVLQEQFVDGPVLLELAKHGYRFRLEPTMDLFSGNADRPVTGPVFVLRNPLAGTAPMDGTHLLAADDLDVWELPAG